MFSKLAPVLLLGCLAPLAAACGGGSDDGSTGDDQNVTAHPAANPAPGELGGSCGGIAGIACKPSLACKVVGEGAGANAMGTCEATMTSCQAMPACDSGDSSVETCAAGDATCYSRSMCGRTIACKKAGSTAPAAMNGRWAADTATMRVDGGVALIEFGCASAEIDAFHFTSTSVFTGTGTRTAGSGVQFPPGMGPQPEPATFSGTLSGNKLTLKMKVGGDTSSMTFTKDRQVNLMRCL